MRNKYPGTCYFCWKPVAKGDGHFERHNGGWRTIHVQCVTRQRTEKQEAKNA